MGKLIVFCTCLSFLMLLMLLYFLAERKKMRNEMETLLQRLDDVLSGKKQDVVYEETLDSAITERLNLLLRRMEISRKRTEEEIFSVKSLVSNISHQIKNPLANIMLYTDILQENLKGEKDRELSDRIVEETEKLEFFIRQLLKTSYTEIEMLQLSPERGSVNELIEKACQEIELAAISKHIEIRKNCHRSSGEQRNMQDSIQTARFDMKWTVEGIANILDNAVKYSDDYGMIEIQVISLESFICVQIADKGPGIREEEQGLIFGRFYRSKDVSSKTGLGIGLYLAREIFQREGGYVKVQSEKGEGSIFKVYLPKF